MNRKDDPINSTPKRFFVNTKAKTKQSYVGMGFCRPQMRVGQNHFSPTLIDLALAHAPARFVFLSAFFFFF